MQKEENCFEKNNMIVSIQMTQLRYIQLISTTMMLVEEHVERAEQ